MTTRTLQFRWSDEPDGRWYDYKDVQGDITDEDALREAQADYKFRTMHYGHHYTAVFRVRHDD